MIEPVRLCLCCVWCATVPPQMLLLLSAYFTVEELKFCPAEISRSCSQSGGSAKHRAIPPMSRRRRLWEEDSSDEDEDTGTPKKKQPSKKQQRKRRRHDDSSDEDSSDEDTSRDGGGGGGGGAGGAANGLGASPPRGGTPAPPPAPLPPPPPPAAAAEPAEDDAFWENDEPGDHAFDNPDPEINLDDAAKRVEVICRSPVSAAEARKGKVGPPLAILIRNLDGANGNRLLALAQIPEGAIQHGAGPKMSAPGRTSAQTQGSGQANDVLDTLVYRGGADEIDERVVELTKEAIRRSGRAPDTSLIFGASAKRHKELPPELELVQRVHLMPLRKEGVTSKFEVGSMRFGQGPDDFFYFRKCHDDEGGRMHGHLDEDGTDAVVLMNIGAACDFFGELDFQQHASPPPPPHFFNSFHSPPPPVDVGSRRHGTRCMAQRKKECWCIGNGGHWATIPDCKDRYKEDTQTSGPQVRYGLCDRLCATCAAGGRGVACATCRPIILKAGDVLVFDGNSVYHGVNKVLPREEPVAGGAAAAAAAAGWFQKHWEDDSRVSVMWRYSNKELRRQQLAKEQGEWHASGSNPARGGRDLLGLIENARRQAQGAEEGAASSSSNAAAPDPHGLELQEAAQLRAAKEASLSNGSAAGYAAAAKSTSEKLQRERAITFDAASSLDGRWSCGACRTVHGSEETSCGCRSTTVIEIDDDEEETRTRAP